MENLNKKIYLFVGFLLVISVALSNVTNATCPLGFAEQINPTISITGVSVTDGIVTIGVNFTAGTRIYRDKDGNITAICYGEITAINLDVYKSDGAKVGSVSERTGPAYSGSDTLQWISPSFKQDTYTLKVYAWDTGITHDLSACISAPDTASVFIDNPLPRITSPADGSTVQGVGRYGVVDVTCEFFSPVGIRTLQLEVWDGHYPLPTRVFVTGHAYSEPYPTSGTCTLQWQSAYRPQGAYNLIVKAMDATWYGAWGRSEPVTVTLVKGPPTASFTYSPENPLIYDEITFDASLSYDDGGIVKYEWDFGDGVSVGSAEVRVVKHAYTQAGDYTVTLTVTDNDGMTGSVGRPVSVREAEQMVEPVEGCVTSLFGNRTLNGEPDDHKGIDIAWPDPRDITGAIVIAPARGVVDNKGDHPNDGYWIRLKHRCVRRRDGTIAENVYTYYCHLLHLPSVEVGSLVRQGDLIGQVGKTGNANRAHLHFGVREGETIDDYVDPRKYLEYRGCKELRVEARSPVDIALVDPDGYIVSKTLIEIEMTATYLEDDFDGDGELEDRIWITDKKVGNYQIYVVPDPQSLPADTYSIEVITDGETIALADQVAVSDIPQQGYMLESTETGVDAGPVADAGGPYEGVAGVSLEFDGSCSYDPDGQIVLAEWDWDSDGTYDYQSTSPLCQHTWNSAFFGIVWLRVTDNDGLSSVDAADVTVTAPFPESVDDLVGISCGLVGYDRRTGQFSTNVTVTNISGTTIGSPVWLVIESISPPQVGLANPDDTTPVDNKPYVNLSGLLCNDRLEPAEAISKRIYFDNPNRLRFTFDPSVYGVILP